MSLSRLERGGLSTSADARSLSLSPLVKTLIKKHADRYPVLDGPRGDSREPVRLEMRRVELGNHHDRDGRGCVDR